MGTWKVKNKQKNRQTKKQAIESKLMLSEGRWGWEIS